MGIADIEDRAFALLRALLHTARAFAQVSAVICRGHNLVLFEMKDHQVSAWSWACPGDSGEWVQSRMHRISITMGQEGLGATKLANCPAHLRSRIRTRNLQKDGAGLYEGCRWPPIELG
jgi:hypothetical protein